MGIAGEAIPIFATKLPVAGFAGSWRKAGVQTVPLLTDAKAGVLAITAWTMTAEPTGLWHRPAAPAGGAIPLGERTACQRQVPLPLRGGE